MSFRLTWRHGCGCMAGWLRARCTNPVRSALLSSKPPPLSHRISIPTCARTQTNYPSWKRRGSLPPWSWQNVRYRASWPRRSRRVATGLRGSGARLRYWPVRWPKTPPGAEVLFLPFRIHRYQLVCIKFTWCLPYQVFPDDESVWHGVVPQTYLARKCGIFHSKEINIHAYSI
jgi:hypothetical protein